MKDRAPNQKRREIGRREFLRTFAASAACGMAFGRKAVASSGLGIPGLYPGRVVGVQHSSSYADGEFKADPIRLMIERGMKELTRTSDWASAWRQFFSPGDKVGIKVNGMGLGRAISSKEAFNVIVDGLVTAGVNLEDIVAFDRYRVHFNASGFANWLPAGVQSAWASNEYHPIQQTIDGYDAAHYVDLPLVLPGQSLSDTTARRSFAATFITQRVDKLINLACLKDHRSAGVTMCLKNLSHGLVNNTARSHPTPQENYCDTFIPAIVSMPVIRSKAVLNILDGVEAVYNAGPEVIPQFLWYHRSMYFGTDPVAVDRIGWKQMDRYRIEMGIGSITDVPPDRYTKFTFRHPEHIEFAGALGLGISDESKIDWRMIHLD